MKFGHVALSVANITRSKAFYTRHFGLRLSEKYSHKDIGLTIALLKGGGFSLELFEFKKHKALPHYRKTLDNDLRTVGVKHFSVEVSDIEGTYKRFKKARVQFATAMRTFGNNKRYFFVKDPDGNLVEVMEN